MVPLANGRGRAVAAWTPATPPGIEPRGHECLGFRFYLGAPEPSWLARAGVPLFVSRVRLARRRALPRAIAPWALDSGAFTELSRHGAWTISPKAYADEVRRYQDEIGALTFASPQDWMCEPQILARTGLTLADHQQRTLDNYLELRQLAPDLPIIPVLQGWTMDDYEAHMDAYGAAGVDLEAAPLVGIGSVCRREGTREIAHLLDFLAMFGIRGHGFGVKKAGLRASARYLESADSMAWSFDARRATPALDPQCARLTHQNCLHAALSWRAEVFAAQLRLPL
jgi:hypothetical protein